MILTFPFMFLAVVGPHVALKNAIDHNMYVVGDYVYQANYASGLQVLEIGDVANSPDLTEIAFFDKYPESDENDFDGAWSNYPYFPSGNVVVSSIDRGLFVLAIPRPECRLEPNICSSFLVL
jgi:choice-of-anchor B domain-containing protein